MSGFWAGVASHSYGGRVPAWRGGALWSHRTPNDGATLGMVTERLFNRW